MALRPVFLLVEGGIRLIVPRNGNLLAVRIPSCVTPPVTFRNRPLDVLEFASGYLGRSLPHPRGLALPMAHRGKTNTMQEQTRLRWLVWIFASTIFVSAFLVFQVQPIISKTILPWFGGSPAVWTTCMLFFQVVLFAGYTYAHLLNKLQPRWQLVVHIGMLAGALLLLPITPSGAWKPRPDEEPTWRIMLLLAANVGLPYFLLSSTGPLVQAWFARTCGGHSPYRLYALSNIGSLAALLSYPFLVEPAMNTRLQGSLWSIGFGLFALLCACCAFRMLRNGKRALREAALVGSAPVADLPDIPPSWGQRFSWLLLPAFASVMLLATTNHVCQDVAVIPFLWILPLSLYLATFIICFDSEGWYWRRFYGAGTMMTVVGVSLMMLMGLYPPLVLEIGIYFAAMFFVCMLCHGELVRRKPSPQYLTSFYLMSSAGGAVGGLFVAVVCPAVFYNYFELNLGLLFGFLFGAFVYLTEVAKTGVLSSSNWRLATVVTVFVALLTVIRAQLGVAPVGHMAIARNFYGVITVDERQSEDPQRRGRVMVHGRIVHGFQYSLPEKRHLATKYFAPESGIGTTLTRFPSTGPLRVGVVGLGVGTIATYGKPGDYYRFYEINPIVIDMAKEYFTYLDDSQADVDVVLGDGRLSLESEPNQNFDVLILDAFSGDGVPTHLLTQEALDIYLRHLKPNGVLAANISNRRVDLRGVFTRLAEYADLQPIEIIAEASGEEGLSSSHWMLGTRNQQFIADDVVQAAAVGMQGRYAHIPLWTDEYTNLLQILK